MIKLNSYLQSMQGPPLLAHALGHCCNCLGYSIAPHVSSAALVGRRRTHGSRSRGGTAQFSEKKKKGGIVIILPQISLNWFHENL